MVRQQRDLIRFQQGQDPTRGRAGGALKVELQQTVRTWEPGSDRQGRGLGRGFIAASGLGPRHSLT